MALQQAEILKYSMQNYVYMVLKSTLYNDFIR